MVPLLHTKHAIGGFGQNSNHEVMLMLRTFSLMVVVVYLASSTGVFFSNNLVCGAHAEMSPSREAIRNKCQGILV